MIKVALAAAALLGAAVIAVYPPETEARILLVAMTVLAWTFAIVYGTRSPWRATQAGRSVMATSVALGLIGAQLASVWIFGDYPGRAEVRAFVVLALVLTLLHRLLVVWRIQHSEVADDVT
ncbi:hypothetical protein GS876_23515 [Rhodococcus hoagii]|nr:hypothetical protein [Prescottella equi]MBM4581010.1 hypothetical protein [Prescottella equi]MBM4581021.1 hypothetical protein [Prescottella equi]MBM4685650.1 hypothetical protein [Prescottella equi]NKU31542.1 hypothetical protein [Prescottella equi]